MRAAYRAAAHRADRAVLMFQRLMRSMMPGGKARKEAVSSGLMDRLRTLDLNLLVTLDAAAARPASHAAEITTQSAASHAFAPAACSTIAAGEDRGMPTPRSISPDR
jgi:hypothetical protein